MACLLDTNILLRSAQPNHPMYRDAVDAIDTLFSRQETLLVVPQVIVEFWTACTRPLANNGLGFTPLEAGIEMQRIEGVFTLLPETPAIFEVWKELVTRYGVSGVETHDARIVAAMKVHGVGSILTFNEKDFRRYPEVQILNPRALLRG